MFTESDDCQFWGNCVQECHAQINWYFRCSIVSLNICKEYLNMATFESLTLDKELNILIHWSPSYVVIYRSYALFKKVQFFGPPYTVCKYSAVQMLYGRAVITSMLTFTTFRLGKCVIFWTSSRRLIILRHTTVYQISLTLIDANVRYLSLSTQQ